jgi:GDP-mannose 6-dehydrogenase
MQNEESSKMRPSAEIAVLGLGYVGSVTAACIAEMGYTVSGVDTDQYKVDRLNDGKAPFYEPGLEPLILRNRQAGRLRATTSVKDALAAASIAMVCVGTPSLPGGGMSREQLHRVALQIAAQLPERGNPLIVAIRSTVWPGTCRELHERFFHLSAMVRMVSHPEFLREGTAVKDFFDPSLIVVGGEDPGAVEAVAGLYRGLPVEPARVSMRTAETIKYACNAFHALKAGFANEIGALCDALEVPGEEVMQTLVRDTRLNLSAAYLRPGFAFGGSCLPKDLRAIDYAARDLNLSLPILTHVLASNRDHLERSITRVLSHRGRRIGVYGLSFKEDTDDVRESPVVLMLEQLLGKGCHLRVFDPHIKLEEIYGANQRYLLQTVPHIGGLMVAAFEDWLNQVDVLVLTQKPRPEHQDILRARGMQTLDLARPAFLGS